MKQVYIQKDKCCGCTACASVCPKQAISLEQDNMGFYYPHIDGKKCIDCNLCVKVCSFTTPNIYDKTDKAYVVKHNNNEVVKESRSGGLFTALSDLILEQKGTVYGAFLDEKMYVKHIRVETKEGRDTLRKSKYVQSDLKGIYRLVENDLRSGKMVMFTGVGCQCDGLKGYIKQKGLSDENLLLCDIVCHSNASPGLFQKYIEYQEKRNHSKVSEYYFRDKEKFSWMEHVEKIVFINRKTIYTNEYTNLFFADDIRPACFNCKYASLKRCSDITLADCWGGEKVYPELVNRNGASLALINSSKGLGFLDRIRINCDVRCIDIENVMQPRLRAAEEKSKVYDTFWKDYDQLEFSDFIKKYSKNSYSAMERLKRKTVKFLKIPVKITRKIRGIQER